MLKEIAKLVSEYSGFTLTEIKSSSRKGELPNTRKVFTYFAKTYTNASYSEINKYIGCTVINNGTGNYCDMIKYNYTVVLDWISINHYLPDYFHTVENLIKERLRSTTPIRNNVEIVLIKELNTLLQNRVKQHRYAKTLPIVDLLEIIKKYE